MFAVKKIHFKSHHGSFIRQTSLSSYRYHSFYDRIKSYYPSSSSISESKQQQITKENNHLFILSDKSLHDASNVIKLPHEYKIIYVIGVSHHSRLSALRVESLCEDVWPDTIFLELCEKRLPQIRLKMALQSPLTHKMYTLFHRLSHFKVFTKYKHGPFIEAIRFGDKKKLKIECGDVSSDETMKKLKDALRAQSKSWEQIINEKNYTKYKFLNHALNEYMMHVRNVFNIGNKDENILRREQNPMRKIEKSRNEAREIVNKYSQRVYGILVGERDKFMIEKLKQCEGNVIVAVVGMGHLDGIEKYWKYRSEDKGAIENVINL